MDEQLYLLAVGLSLEEKVQKAIANLQEYEREALKQDPENGYWLCDSYGKDSGVILDLAKRSGVKFKAHHNLTTLDPPELIYHGRKNHLETIVHKPKVSMLTRMIEKTNGPPTRRARWCCEEYKEQDNQYGIKIRVFGVRAAESARRKANWKIWQPNRRGGWILNPILYWTGEDVWRYTKENNIPYCSLYDEGWTRLGCIGCPMAGNKRKQEFQRWPKYESAWKRAFQKFWDKWHNVPKKDKQPRWFDRNDQAIKINSWQDLWSWWMEEMPKQDDDECQMGLF